MPAPRQAKGLRPLTTSKIIDPNGCRWQLPVQLSRHDLLAHYVPQLAQASCQFCSPAVNAVLNGLVPGLFASAWYRSSGGACGRRYLLERRHAGRDVVREDRGDGFGIRRDRRADGGLCCGQCGTSVRSSSFKGFTSRGNARRWISACPAKSIVYSIRLTGGVACVYGHHASRESPVGISPVLGASPWLPPASRT